MRQVVEIALFTDDVAATREFYEPLVGVGAEAEWPGGAVYAVGELKLLIHERTGGTDAGPANEDHVALGAPDLDQACDDLRERGFSFLVEPRDYYWGRSAYLRDPDGRIVELSQA